MTKTQKQSENLETLLNDLGACSQALKWAKGKTLKQAWRTCERPDWLLWLAGRMVDKKGWPSRKKIVQAACDCAETILHLTSDERPKHALLCKIIRRVLTVPSEL